MLVNRDQESRREWLRRSTAAAGSLLIVRPESVRGTQANSKVTFGLIGAGNRGSYDASIAHADPRAEVNALCDLFDDRIEQAIQRIRIQGKPAIYKDYQKLLASDVDAVIIATPPFLHPEQLEAAVQARKHVYCEKPMGVDVEGCKRVIAAGRKADPKKCISVGFQQRYGPVYLEAYRRIREGQIGEIVNARAFWIGGDPFKRVPYPDPRSRSSATGSATGITRGTSSSSRIAIISMCCTGSWAACPFAQWVMPAGRCAPTWRSWIT
jgi:myo-inositol 2-dehydrogenase/D-chiro-inositol 1-dehydrogenase